MGEYQGNGIAEALNGRLKIRTTFLVPGKWLYGHAVSCWSPEWGCAAAAYPSKPKAYPSSTAAHSILVEHP